MWQGAVLQSTSQNAEQPRSQQLRIAQSHCPVALPRRIAQVLAVVSLEIFFFFFGNNLQTMQTLFKKKES